VNEKSSEWHEQVEFSELYFKEHTKCREAQRANQSEIRANAVKSKIQMAMGILNDDEKEKGKKLIDNVNLALINYQKSLSYEERVGTTPLDVLSQVLNERLDDVLDESESDIDTMVNKHMPFLNIKKDIDIRGL